MRKTSAHKNCRPLYLTIVNFVLVRILYAKNCTDNIQNKLDPATITIYVQQQGSYYTVPYLNTCDFDYTATIHPDNKLMIKFDAMSSTI